MQDFSCFSEKPLPPIEGRWAAAFEHLCQRIHHLFERREARLRAKKYLYGLLSSVKRKNGWQIAEEVGESAPYNIQHLLDRAKWDCDGLRDEVRTYVYETLVDSKSVLVVDETGFLKKGTKSVGVQRQYSGTAGRIENCQIGVFLAYASAKGHAFIDRELYLPKSWTEDRQRCQVAGVPPEVEFATKPQLLTVRLNVRPISRIIGLTFKRTVSYLDRMSDLLLIYHLQTSQPGSPVRAIAQARTVTALRDLDTTRQVELVRFLWKAGLIIGEQPIMSLNAAPLTFTKFQDALLNSINLSEALLNGSTFDNCDLQGAIFIGTNLTAAILENVNLTGVNMTQALLPRANLSEDDLTKVNLTGANLAGANLKGAMITPDQLKQVASLQGAIMPDGSKHP